MGFICYYTTRGSVIKVVERFGSRSSYHQLVELYQALQDTIDPQPDLHLPEFNLEENPEEDPNKDLMDGGEGTRPTENQVRVEVEDPTVEEQRTQRGT